MYIEKTFDLDNFDIAVLLPHYLRAGWRVKHHGKYYIVLYKKREK